MPLALKGFCGGRENFKFGQEWRNEEWEREISVIVEEEEKFKRLERIWRDEEEKGV